MAETLALQQRTEVTNAASTYPCPWVQHANPPGTFSSVELCPVSTGLDTFRANDNLQKKKLMLPSSKLFKRRFRPVWIQQMMLPEFTKFLLVLIVLNQILM